MASQKKPKPVKPKSYTRTAGGLCANAGKKCKKKKGN